MPITICPTAVVGIRGSDGHYYKARALLDTGASVSVITQSLVNKLKLHQQSNRTKIYGVGNNSVDLPGTSAKLVIKPIGKPVPIISTVAIVMYHIAVEIPSFPINCRHLIRDKGIILSDQNFDTPQELDLILGTDVLNYVYEGSKISLNVPDLNAYKTCFGHVIMGSLLESMSDSSPRGCTSVNDYGIMASRLEEVLERFWKVEEPPSPPAVHPDHMECERLYNSSVSRMPDGKYMVRLPLLSERPVLGESKALAMQRLKSLERKMDKNPVFATKYREFMEEYERLGHMSLSRFQFDSEHFIIPHHGIFSF